MQGSYRIDDFSLNFQAEVGRLRDQVALFFPLEFPRYCALGLRDGMDIVECGSGPGFLLQEILARLPGCRATAVEVDPRLVEVLRSGSRRGERELYRVVQASITETGLPEASCDVAIVRLVLEHLPDPLAALHEMWRILRPGGRLLVVSNDFALHLVTHPPVAGLEELYSAYCRSQQAKGGNPLLGRQLPGLLARGGFNLLSFEVLPAHNRLRGDTAMLKAENANISARLVEEGFLERAALDRLAASWHRMLKTEGHVIYRQLFLACGEKGAGEGGGLWQAEEVSPLSRSTAADVAGIKQAVGEERRRRLLDYLRQTAAEALGLADASTLHTQHSLNSQGIDSVAAVEIDNILTADFGVDLSHTELMESLSLQDLCEKLLACLDDSTAPAPAAEETPPPAWEEGEL